MSTCYVSDEGSQDHTKHLVHICCEWRFSANGEPTCRLVGKERHFVSFVLIEKVSTICQGLFFLLCTLQWNPLTTMWSLSVLHDYLLRNSLAHFPFLYVKQCRQNKKILVRFTYVLFIYLFLCTVTPSDTLAHILVLCHFPWKCLGKFSFKCCPCNCKLFNWYESEFNCLCTIF